MDSNLSNLISDVDSDNTSKGNIENESSNIDKIEPISPENVDVDVDVVKESFFKKIKRKKHKLPKNNLNNYNKIIYFMIFILCCFAASTAVFFYFNIASNSSVPFLEDVAIVEDQETVGNILDASSIPKVAIQENDPVNDTTSNNNLSYYPGVILQNGNGSVAITESTENKYIKKIDNLAFSFNAIKMQGDNFRKDIDRVLNELSELRSNINEVKWKLKDIPSTESINKIKSQQGASIQKLESVNSRVSRLDARVDNSNERAISNSTKIDIYKLNSTEDLNKIIVLTKLTDQKISMLEDKFSKKTFVEDQPSRVTFQNGTSITQVPKSIDPYSDFDNKSKETGTIINALILKKVLTDSNKIKTFILVDAQNNNYELKINNQLNDKFGYINEFIDGTFDSEPYLKTSNDYIITTKRGQNINKVDS